MVDLLAPKEDIGVKAKPLSIIDDSRGGVAVKNLTMHTCDSEGDALNMLFEGELNRCYDAHELNDRSSRSHCIYTMYIESRSRVESTEKIVYSKLQLVDLAGSERTKKTGTHGTQLTEARYINKSLTFLEQVVLALSDRKRDHIPYRQAMLTNYLRDSIGGNCKTCMVANVQCQKLHIEETISTLKFAQRMMKVRNEATVNLSIDPTLAIKRYEKEIRDLKQELAMHDTLSNRGRVNYDTYSNEELMKIKTLTRQYLTGEIEDIEQLDSLRMIREIFTQIRSEYKQTSQHIESLKRQMAENPEKFRQMMEDQDQKDKEGDQQKKEMEEQKKKEEEAKVQPPAEGEEPADETQSKVEEVPEQKTKRPAVEKQVAYMEFKDGPGKQIEQSILESRNEMKEKRKLTKDLTQSINELMRQLDAIKVKLQRKEEEREQENKQRMQNLDAFGDDDEGMNEEIIDEEELMFLKQKKELQREYREKFSQLKVFKQDIKSINENIDTQKEQLIFQFEEWYAQEFQVTAGKQEKQLNLEQVEATRTVMSQGKETASSHQPWFEKQADEDMEEEALVYKRAKESVDELHRARKFEKSIKLK